MRGPIYGIMIGTVNKKTGMSRKLSTLSLPEITAALKDLSVAQTRELIVLLGVRLETVKDIECESSNDDETKRMFLRVWFQEEINPSWLNIVSALKKIQMHFLASRIEHECGLETTAFSVTVDSPPNVPMKPDVISAAVFDETASQQRVKDVKIDIDFFIDEFSDIVTSLESTLSHRQERDRHFLNKFRIYLLSMPVGKKASHLRFFKNCEDDILEARSVLKMIGILLRYCSYSNHEVIYHIIKRFGDEPLQAKMESFRQAFEAFEKRTSIDTYLLATSANGELRDAFSRMAIRMNKPAAECKLYEIRMMKEEIIEKASLESYDAYITSMDMS